MAELMERWQEFAAGDEMVRGVVDGAPRVSGTDRRITWRTRARDGFAVIVTSEPKKAATASLVVNQMDLPTPELNEESRERWADVVGRFLAGTQQS